MRYYKAVLCTCDKDLRYLKSGYVNLIDIHENLNIHRDDLIIKVDDDGNATECRINEEITFLNGQKVKMQEGFFWVQEDTNRKGYTIAYYCNSGDTKCELILESSS